MVVKEPRVVVEAPADMDLLDVAQAVVGKHVLLKAEPLRYHERTFQHYLAMKESAEAFEAAYKAQLAKMLREVLRYAEKHIVLGDLGKSLGRKPYAPVVRPHDLHAIRKLISDYHLAFIAGQIGTGFVSPVEIQRLIDAGILPQDLGFTFHPAPHELPPTTAEVIARAYNYGIELGRDPLLRSQAKSLSLEAFNQRDEPELSGQERSAREWASHNTANVIVGLGNRVADDFSTVAIEADADLRRQYQADIREEMDMHLARRDSWRKLASDLGHRTGDWARNFKRIAATEKQSAMQEGLAAGLIEREGDPKHILVAKQPNPDACPDCVSLHLTAGPGSNPRIFKLSELQMNGTNVGKKRNAWKAVVGPVHPWCACELIHVPHGWGFSEDGDLVPSSMLRADLLTGDLRKSLLTYGRIVPERGCAIRIGDPVKRAVAEEVVSRTPKELFDRRVGITLICEDEPRVQNALTEHDLGYWTGNEIRVAARVPAEKLRFVLEHELGHALNVYLMHEWGGEGPVKAWHKKLYRVSVREGFVSPYAQTAPIENAAELTRLYLFDRKLVMAQFPRAFALLDAAYRTIWRPRERRQDRPGEPMKQEQDAKDNADRGGARL